MTASLRRYVSESLRADLTAGLTVAVVALPQSVAFSMIAGAPPAFGLYAAIVACIVGALFGSSSHLVTGPTNATALMVAATMVDPPNGMDVADAIVLYTFLIGIMKLAFGVFRLGGFVKYISDSVIIGFTAGAGILIAGLQLRNVLGVDPGAGRSAGFIAIVAATLRHLPEANGPTVILAAATAAAILLMQRVDRRVPGALIACVAGAVVVYLSGMHEAGVRLAGDIGPIPRSLPQFRMVPANLELARRMLPGALAVTVIGLMEATAITRSIAAWSGQRLNPSREFVGQGMANVVSAFFSCFASSGSLTRSALNYQSGAKTRMAAVFSGVIVLAVVLLFGPLGEYIPVASLAGLLMIVAYQMVNRDRLRLAMRAGRESAIVLVVTFFATVLLRLDIAIAVGVAISLAFFIKKSAEARLTVLLHEEDGGFREVSLDALDPEALRGRIAVINLIGALYFGALGEYRDQLQSFIHAEPRAVVLRLRRVTNIDSSGLAGLEALHEHLRSHGIPVTVCGVDDELLRTLKRSGFVGRIGPENVIASKDLVFNSIATSVERAADLADRMDTT